MSTALEYKPGDPSVTFFAGVKLKPRALRPDADRVINALIGLGKPFSADDIREQIPGIDAVILGELFRLNSTAGTIRRIGDFKSQSKSRKGGRNSIWIASESIAPW